jgi:hypothetical protein
MSTLQRAVLQSLRVAATLGAAATLITACSGGALTPPTTTGAASPLESSPALNAPGSHVAPRGFSFTTLDDQADPTFNQLLGINNRGKIAGYFGSGLSGHPNKGYVLVPPYGQNNYINENFPGSAQTQVTAINTHGDTAGFWANAANANFGFIEWKSVFTSYTDPKTHHGTVNQILGINDKGIAVGFYVDGKGNSHGFTLNQATGQFTPVIVSGAASVVATGINDNGDITGTATSPPPSKQTTSFLLKGTSLTAFSFPNGSDTQSFGINIHDQMVGSYLDAGGVLHGFLLSTPLTHAKWRSIDDPNGVGSTVINGLNDKTEMVGFYTDAAGNTDGMLITPTR